MASVTVNKAKNLNVTLLPSSCLIFLFPFAVLRMVLRGIFLLGHKHSVHSCSPLPPTTTSRDIHFLNIPSSEQFKIKNVRRE